MNHTGISWTDYTWNPVSGCTKISEGCKFCYAEALSHRWGRSFDVVLHPEKLKEIKNVPSGSKVFVNSMSDLFHPDVPFDFIYSVFVEMYHRKDITFQILTKRPERMKEFFGQTGHPIMRNMWLGVSVESAEYRKRIKVLRDTMLDDSHFLDDYWTAFVSFEPLISSVGKLDFEGVKWIIIGGESGPNHRPMKIEWAEDIIRQALNQGVAVWMKQLGGIRPGGELEDFPQNLRIREFPDKTGMMEVIS